MVIQDLKGKLTNKIIEIGEVNLINHEKCIGATFLKNVLETRGIDYNYVSWMSSSGIVSIYGHVFEVTSYYRGEKFKMITQVSTFWNRVFPKRIILKFKKIG